jgi:hypothetical protein
MPFGKRGEISLGQLQDAFTDILKAQRPLNALKNSFAVVDDTDFQGIFLNGFHHDPFPSRMEKRIIEDLLESISTDF